MSTNELMGELDSIQAEIHEAAVKVESALKRRSEVLRALTTEIKGKNFVRKGHKYTICQRGETYFLKGGPGKQVDVPTFD